MGLQPHFFSKKPSSSWKAELGMPLGSFTMLQGALSSKAILAERHATQAHILSMLRALSLYTLMCIQVI